MNLFLRFCSLFYIVTIEVLYLVLQEKGYYNASGFGTILILMWKKPFQVDIAMESRL